MYVRLAFGVAAHLEPDILLVDEVLAVGDAAFQQKCLGKIGSVVREGRTVLFVSHNMATVASLCSRGVLIDQGRVILSGSPQAVIEEYLTKARVDARVPVADRTDRRGDGRVRFTRATILNDRLEPVERVSSGQGISIRLDYDTGDAVVLKHASVQLRFTGVMGQPLFACVSGAASRDALTLTAGGYLLCTIPRLPLLPGVYTFTLWCAVGDTLADFVWDAGQVTVVEGDYFGTGKLPPNRVGDFLVAHTWSAE